MVDIFEILNEPNVRRFDDAEEVSQYIPELINLIKFELSDRSKNIDPEEVALVRTFLKEEL